jgi:hypothetical protein
MNKLVPLGVVRAPGYLGTSVYRLSQRGHGGLPSSEQLRSRLPLAVNRAALSDRPILPASGQRVRGRLLAIGAYAEDRPSP